MLDSSNLLLFFFLQQYINRHTDNVTIVTGLVYNAGHTL